MNRGTSTVVGVIVLLIGATSVGWGQEGVPVPSLEEIASTLERNRARIETVHLTCEYRIPGTPGQAPEKVVRTEQYIKGEKIAATKSHLRDSNVWHESSAVWDGKEYRALVTDTGKSSPGTGNVLPAYRSVEAEPLISPIRLSGLDRGPKRDGVSITTTDLVANFREPGYARVLPDREIVDGLACVVVACGPTRYLLDEHRGFAVVVYEHVDQKTGKLAVRAVNRDFKEVLPDLWLPTLIERHLSLSRIPTAPSYDRLQVTALEVNVDIPDSRFVLAFPPGTGVVDKVRDRRYVMPDMAAVGYQSHDELEAAMDAVLPVEEGGDDVTGEVPSAADSSIDEDAGDGEVKLQADTHSNAVQDTDGSSSYGWVSIAAAAVLFVIVVIAAALRWIRGGSRHG